MISMNRMSAMLVSMKQTIFAIMFLMSETTTESELGTRGKFISVCLMFIDFLQVLRTTVSVSLGWSPASAAVVSQIARADVADAVIQSVSPNGSKALVGVAMAIICITACNLAFVFWQIKTDNLDHIWPIRMLRGIIIITITTLFPTFLDLCLRPLNVRIARFFQMKRSCVQLMPFNRIANVSVHVALIVEQCDFWSDASPCNTSPYSWPQVLVSIISIFLASFLILIGLVCSLLFLDFDLLTHEPLSSLHGRTMMQYLVLQIALILVPNFFPSNTTPIVPIIFFLFAGHLSYNTLRLLPHMFRLTNYIKVSMMFMLTYSLFIAIFAAGGTDQDSLLTALYAGYPIAAVLGLAAVHTRCVMLEATAQKSLANLPPAMVHHSALSPPDNSQPSAAATAGDAPGSRWSLARRIVQTGVVQADSPLELKFSTLNKVHRYMREHAESEFFTAEDVIAAVKVMLWQRDRSTVPKIKQLLRASMLQHGESDWTAIFSICFVYCVEEDMDKVAGLIESVKHLELNVECQYLKFAVSRALIQRFKSTHVGGMLSAIGLLEVTSVQDEVSRLHRLCVRTLRSYWQAAALDRDVETLSGHLEGFLISFQQAEFMMKDMLIKYPNSVVFLRAYGAFMRDICHDRVKSTELFSKADSLENSSDGVEDVGGSKSLSSGAYRNVAINAWTQNVLQRDIDMMDAVSKNMRNTLVILLTVSTVVYCVLEFVLLASASSHLHDIFVLNKARSSTISAIYFARDAYFAAIANNSVEYSRAIEKLVAAATIAKSFISNMSFSDDTYSFFFFSSELAFFPQVSGPALPEHISPASGMQLFADACLQFAAIGMPNLNTMIQNNDFSSSHGRALQFMLLNGDSPLLTSYNAGGMYLQGQAVSFVYLSGVFFVIAGVVVVMLGVHMVVLARRLLSEAIVLLRTSTICISASLHLSQISRKHLSAYYKKLDQEFSQMSGEAGIEAADGGDVAAEGVDSMQQRRPDTPDRGEDDSASSSDLSSDGKPHMSHALGTEVSAEDKDLMVKAFLEGKNFINPPIADDVDIDRASHGDEVPEDSKNAFSAEIPSREESFVTPPTKLFQRSGSAKNVGISNSEQLTSDEVPQALDIPSGNKMKTRFQNNSSSKSVSSSKKQAFDANANYSDEKHGSVDGSSSWSERNQRDRKMAFIIILCASIFVIFNSATYLYLRTVKVGSTVFNQLHLLLELQAELDLPVSRFFPILAHVVSLMNPLLVGKDRQIQTEHLKDIVIDFKDSLANWLVVYHYEEGLQVTLRNELSIGIDMLNHLESYTFPYLEAGQYEKARCDFFGPFVSQQNAYSTASKEALKEIRKKQVFVDASVYEASTTLESCIFTLMPVLTVFTLAFGGLAFTTDAQRTRLAAMWKSVTNGWNRLVNRNRVYNFETSDKITTDSGLRIDVQGEASSSTHKSLERLFEKSATLFICICCILLLANAVLLHVIAVPSIIMSGSVFEDFESTMEFIASQASPSLFLAEVYTQATFGIFGFQCNASEVFFGMRTPELLVQQLEKQFNDFEDAHQKWSLRLSELTAIKSNLEYLRESGQPIHSVFKDRIAPLVLSKNYSAAMSIVESAFFDELALHESIAEEVSQKCDLLYQNTRALASFGRDTALWFIYGISSMLFGVVAFISFLLIRDASLYKLELSDVAADPSSVLHHIIPKLLEVHEKQQSVMSQRAMLMSFGLVIGIQILGIALPIRFLGGLAQQSPIANQVGRLDVLFIRNACLSRDLIIRDELGSFFMHGSGSLVSLASNNRNFIETANLLRYGGSWGIELGRRGNPEILAFWEQSGCLISNSQSAVTKCSDSTRVMHEARMNGLGTLLQMLYNSVDQIPHLVKTIPKTSTLADRIKFARTTPELSFINSNVHDDARQGIATLTSMEESATIMVSMISELRILFGLNIGFAFFVLYYATFLRTISNVVHQARLSRIFLATIPIESITKVQADRLRSLFFPNSQEE